MWQTFTGVYGAFSVNKQLVRLHSETVKNLQWCNNIRSLDKQQAMKADEIWPKMAMFGG